LPRGPSVAILGGSSNPQESPVIAKLKPPSQRPERKLDDVARAIARLNEITKSGKAADADRPAFDASSKSRQGQPGMGVGSRNVGGRAPDISTKRPKKG